MADDPDRDAATGQFVKGKKGGPGRPKGARSQLGEAFLLDMQAAWAAKGPEVIEAVIEERPQDFLKVVASLMPKELLLRKPPMDEMTEAEIADKLDALDDLVALARGAGSTPGKARH